MTICIAAISESGRKVVLCADRMFTAPSPLSLEFETEEQKIEALAPKCAALLSGNSGYGTEVLNGIRKSLGGSQSPTMADVTARVNNEYISARASKVQEAIIIPALGSDFSSFIQRGGTLPNYLQVQPQVYQQLVVTMQQFNMNLEIVVAGIDQSGAHIARITHPGTFVWLDKLGYDAIGSGGIHALTRMHLGGQTSRSGFLDTLYAVYNAKKASEVAPGVGRVTDIAVIDSEKGFSYCQKAVLDVLEKIHLEATKKSTVSLDELGKVYNDQHKTS